jgi:hypothetical protein
MIPLTRSRGLGLCCNGVFSRMPQIQSVATPINAVAAAVAAAVDPYGKCDVNLPRCRGGRQRRNCAVLRREQVVARLESAGGPAALSRVCGRNGGYPPERRLQLTREAGRRLPSTETEALT